jgi:replicative DNA helicase
MVSLFDEGETVDQLTLAQRSKLPREVLLVLAAAAPQASSALTYAKDLIALAERRKLVEAGELLVAAGRSNDLSLRDEAEVLMAARLDGVSRTYSPDDLSSRFFDRLERGQRKAYSWPNERLNDLVGGLRPGEVTLIGGWTSHGKSVFLDDVLVHVSQQATTHLFINEMTADERTDRLIAKRTGVPALIVSQKDQLAKGQLAAVVAAIPNLPFGITEAAGWTVQEIGREIRRRSYQVVGVDIIHLIEYREERDLASISRALNVVAKETGCHILATVHLKDERLKTSVPPPPTLSDIKGAGALKQDADNVMFVYRECDDVGAPGDDAKIWFAKARQGQTGGIRGRFNGNRMRFEMEDR